MSPAARLGGTASYPCILLLKLACGATNLQAQDVRVSTQLRPFGAGYNLEATASGVEACLRVCLGERPPPLRPEGQAVPGPQPAALAAIHQTIAAQVHLAVRTPCRKHTQASASGQLALCGACVLCPSSALHAAPQPVRSSHVISPWTLLISSCYLCTQARYWSCLQGLLPRPPAPLPLYQPAATLQPLRAPSAALSDDWLLPIR